MRRHGCWDVCATARHPQSHGRQRTSECDRVMARPWHRIADASPVAASRLSPVRPAALNSKGQAPFSVVRPAGALPAERLCRSEEHTSELQSIMRISYAVLCLKKNKHPKELLLKSFSH